jgi:hypothetical protein
MILVHYLGRLGNNLFQYALGRILAEELGWALEAGRIEGFPRTGQRVEGAVYREPVQQLTGYRADVAAIVADRTPRQIVLRGYFQRYEIFRPYRQRLQDWFQLNPATRPDPDAVVVNVRRTDYIQYGWALPFSFYQQAIERSGARRVVIVTDDRRDPFFRRFRKYRPTFFEGNPIEQMGFMAAAKRLVLSQSTFSWWPTFLGEIDQVFCPVPKSGIWSENDCHLIEPDRFTCIDCPEAYRPDRIETAYQMLRQQARKIGSKICRLRGLPDPYAE